MTVFKLKDPCPFERVRCGNSVGPVGKWVAKVGNRKTDSPCSKSADSKMRWGDFPPSSSET